LPGKSSSYENGSVRFLLSVLGTITTYLDIGAATYKPFRF
jgi:hypothetical protein